MDNKANSVTSSTPSSAGAEASPLLHGHCYCGEITFSIPANVEPHIATYCHCESCRRAHSSPLYQVVYIKPEEFVITAGTDMEFIDMKM
jgi:hypothetical protein